MKMKTTMRYYYIPSKMAKIMKLEHTKCWQECGRQTLITANRHVHCYNYFGKQVRRYLLKVKSRLSYDPAVRLLDIHLAEKCAPKQETQWVCSNNTIVNSSSQKQSSPEIEWINTLWHSQTSQHYATINSNVDDSHSIMLSERSQTQWNKHRYGEEGKW